MDFFDDPSLFEGGLGGLDEDDFHSAPSLVDELNLSADFEPIHVEPLGPGKHQDMMPPVSTQQTIHSFSQPMGHYVDMKAQNPMGQAFSGSRSTCSGMIMEQRGQFHNTSMTQVPQSNGLFCNSSSPMWGNQEQNGNMYQPLSQPPQLCHQQQQLHNQQLHARQQTQQQQHHHPCHQQEEQHRRMQQQQLQQQQSHQQQLLNQHQQINTQTMSLQQQQHHNFSFPQRSQSNAQQQMHCTQQQVQHQLTVREQQFHPRTLSRKSYLESQNASLSGTCLQTQQQPGSYQLIRGGQAFSGSGPKDPNLPFPMHSSSMVHSLPTCSVSSASAYQTAQYPAYPGEPEIPSLSQQSLSSGSVCRPATSAPLTSAVPEISGTACQFPSTAHMSQQLTRTPVSQAEECPFRALRCSEETQGNCKSSEMFGESMSCYPSIVSHLPSEQTQSCGVINTNGFQALGDSLLPSDAQDEDLDGLEPPDLLPDLLPQLEDAFRQQDESNCSWADSIQEKGHEYRKPPPIEYKEEKVMHPLRP